jgi:hypothetical protein
MFPGYRSKLLETDPELLGDYGAHAIIQVAEKPVSQHFRPLRVFFLPADAGYNVVDAKKRFLLQ